ncbi:DUF397 domain-containing protein [Streptomyces roseifaciens]|uniref:DUF397 domain-containing protein n=1 Tax=Streptomyces roseifaciens TaxID=1488406 RepID=UPI000717ED32|nr:DUF397 domain-containing protein [Streptomyces roseifaciens]
MSTDPDISRVEWVKSSYSGAGGGNCLEWAWSGPPGIVPVRDSKTPDGPVLAFPPTAWAAFVTAVRNGDA